MRRRLPAALLVSGLTVTLAACGSSDDAETLTIGGSATVYPITELVVQETGTSIDMEAEGTLDGFERFCSGETDINNASEAITQEFLQQCEDNGVEFIEVPIGLDALSVVRNLDNDAVEDLSLEELQQIWGPDSSIERWSDLRADLPDERIELFGRDDGSGTFEYFTHSVTGEAGEIREDYESTDDLDELTEWIAEEPNGLGFMGAGNYLSADDEARSQLSTVAVDGVEPSLENAQSGEYQPLTRPLFLYVNKQKLDESQTLQDFTESYIDSADEIMPRVFFYRLPEASYDQVRERLDSGETGSLYGGDPFLSTSVVELLEQR